MDMSTDNYVIQLLITINGCFQTNLAGKMEFCSENSRLGKSWYRELGYNMSYIRTEGNI